MLSNRRVFLKQVGTGAVSFGLFATFPQCQSADHSLEASTDLALPRSTPEAQGISSAGIREFLDAVEQSNIEFHSIMIVRHGHVVAEGWWAPYAPELKHSLYSLSKSFTSTAVGLAVNEGHFTVDDPVVSFFPEDVPENITSNLGAMKVKHLLTMSTGHGQDTMGRIRNVDGKTWVQAFLDLPVEYEPGTHFLYNTGATYMLSAIVQKTTGQTLMEYLKPRLFDPLGIEGMDWLSSPEGINTGGYGLRVKTEDIARFGQLYLQKGQWKGEQIIPAAWVEEATSKQVNSTPSSGESNPESDWAQGYGYQFWRCKTGGYRGDGAYGQYCLVMPDKDAVIAITSESFDMQASMNLVWDYLLPAMKDEATLPADENAQNQLKEDLENLAYEPPKMNTDSPVAEEISGKTFTLDENDFQVQAVAFNFHENACVFSITGTDGEYEVNCGMNEWIEEKNERTESESFFAVPGRTDPTHTAASATWQDDNTMVMTWRFIETAHSDQLTCIFDKNKVTLQFLNSVAAGNPNNTENRPELHGTMV